MGTGGAARAMTTAGGNGSLLLLLLQRREGELLPRGPPPLPPRSRLTPDRTTGAGESRGWQRQAKAARGLGRQHRPLTEAVHSLAMATAIHCSAQPDTQQGQLDTAREQQSLQLASLPPPLPLPLPVHLKLLLARAHGRPARSLP